MYWISLFLRRLLGVSRGISPAVSGQADMLSAINSARRAASAPEMRLHPVLNTVAGQRAAAMQHSGILSHVGFPAALADAGVLNPPYGEVIAQGQATAAEAVADWLADPPHKAILLDPGYTICGCASAGGYWCCDLAATASS